MWAFIGILVVVIALGAGPIMWIRPSPRQKQVAGYRQKAAQLGLRVKLVSLKSIGISQDIVSVKDGLPFYGIAWNLTDELEKAFAKKLAHESWCLSKGTYEHGAHFMDIWDWGTSKKADEKIHSSLKEFIASLPDDVIACECSGQGLALGWLEKGKVDRVDELASLLEKFKEACLGG